jgi:Ca2+-binding EF-hand superfamily protein
MFSKKWKLVFVTSATLVAGAAGFAAAQGGHHDPARKAAMMKKFDTNQDGKLDQTERAARAEERAIHKFAKLDTDGDGKLSLDEFKAGQRQGRGHHRGGMRPKP